MIRMYDVRGCGTSTSVPGMYPYMHRKSKIEKIEPFFVLGKVPKPKRAAVNIPMTVHRLI